MVRRIAAKAEYDYPKQTERRRGRPKTLFTDEQVAHMRWLYECNHQTAAMIARIFNADPRYIYTVTSCQTRSKIAPKRSDDSEIAVQHLREPEAVSVVVEVKMPVIPIPKKRNRAPGWQSKEYRERLSRHIERRMLIKANYLERKQLRQEAQDAHRNRP